MSTLDCPSILSMLNVAYSTLAQGLTGRSQGQRWLLLARNQAKVFENYQEYQVLERIRLFLSDINQDNNDPILAFSYND